MYFEIYYSPSKSILSHHLKNYGDKFLLHSNYGVADLTKPLPEVYRECTEAWATSLRTTIFARPRCGSDTVE